MSIRYCIYFPVLLSDLFLPFRQCVDGQAVDRVPKPFPKSAAMVTKMNSFKWPHLIFDCYHPEPKSNHAMYFPCILSVPRLSSEHKTWCIHWWHLVTRTLDYARASYNTAAIYIRHFYSFRKQAKRYILQLYRQIHLLATGEMTLLKESLELTSLETRSLKFIGWSFPFLHRRILLSSRQVNSSRVAKPQALLASPERRGLDRTDVIWPWAESSQVGLVGGQITLIASLVQRHVHRRFGTRSLPNISEHVLTKRGGLAKVGMFHVSSALCTGNSNIELFDILLEECP